ncbi:PucR family transcriptional regulator [Amycolatopsis ruanii]|uniref:PucR family transcriptional regulator n=1 Tax=Amycolatopsis ruanii TaxID=944491 RepID=UPI000E274371|nr:helix-turn-helix domain-containing protein [Amycolatopsis ruanii]
MVSVRSVVDRVGPTLLHAVQLPDPCPAVADVVIAEPGASAQLAAGDLVLGVATGDPDAAVELIDHSAAAGAAAVLLKPPVARKPQVRRAAKAAGIALIEVRAATAWAQLVWLLRTVLDAAAEEPESLEGDPGSGDLFRLAIAVAAVVDAPVTIEDTNSRVLAYSARQDITDPARVSTIMGRRIPDDVLAKFRSRGVFRELSRGRQTIFVPAQRDGTLPRLIVPIRMGGELLGSMWAVVRGPVSDERAAAFADTAPVVALHLLRRRAHADAQRRASAELLRAVLEGKAGPRAAIAELELTDEPHRVVVVDTPGDDEGLRLALMERMSLGIGRRPIATELGGLLYTVVPDGADWPSLADASRGAPRVAAGSAVKIGELPRSRAEAEETLSLLRAGVIEGPSGSFDGLWTALALHRTATAASAAGVAGLGPLEQLREYDRINRTDYVETLYEWLRHPGDPRSAAQALRIHPNTFRYRMRRVLELVPLDLDDPDVRLALLVQLVAVRWS